MWDIRIWELETRNAGFKGSRIGRVARITALLFCAMTFQPEVAFAGEFDADDQPSPWSFDIGIQGGSLTPVDRSQSSWTSGSGEGSISWHGDSGIEGSLNLASLEFENGRNAAPNDRVAGDSWHGSNLGLGFGYRLGRAKILARAGIGNMEQAYSVNAAEDEDTEHQASSWGFRNYGIQAGYTLWRWQETHLEFTAAVEKWDFQGLGEMGRDKFAPFGSSGALHNSLGLKLSFYPGSARDQGANEVHFLCGTCIDLGARALFEGGALLGKALSTGLLHGLSGLH